MMREKSPPPDHNNRHFIENYKYNQLHVSLKEYLEINSLKKGFIHFFQIFTQNWQLLSDKYFFSKNPNNAF